MKKKHINLLYILGAGRSGSTALATFLGASEDICVLGEMHQFYAYLSAVKDDSSSSLLEQNAFWHNVFTQLPHNHHQNAKQIDRFNSSLEAHSKIPLSYLSLVNHRNQQEYLQKQEELFKIIQKQTKSKYLLDSSKYVGRFLRLRQSPYFSTKGIYLVRDVRGVIWSFQKKVQTSNPPIKTILYYCLINLWAEIVYLSSPKGSIIKIRYEDLMEKPINTLQQIGTFTGADMGSAIEKLHQNRPFSMPTIIGGNRIKSKSNIYFHKDLEWQQKMPRRFKFMYYLITWPLNLINGYKIRGITS